jgi:hypothetical protein
LPHLIVERHRIAERWRSKMGWLACQRAGFGTIASPRCHRKVDPDGLPPCPNERVFCYLRRSQVPHPLGRRRIGLYKSAAHGFHAEIPGGEIEQEMSSATGPFSAPIPPIVPGIPG